MQTTKELQTRLDSLANSTLDKELTTISICFGIDAKPTYSFDVYLGPKNNDNDKQRTATAHRQFEQ
ncbi:MAG: hypothetical protein HOM15_03080 [Gammaproteobacteria bacterium]|nr:hypothetical protein [Gammaproteobacteria bacterium]MBT5825751.1 hypothetical protein [Gammaproteobacteria bacterium]